MKDEEKFDGNSEEIHSPTNFSRIKFEKVVVVGRQRKEEGLGKRGVPSIKEMFFYFFRWGKFPPDMSKEMQQWYTHYYISKQDGTTYRGELKGRSHAKYLEWRREYNEKFGRNPGTTNFKRISTGRGDAPTGAILQFERGKVQRG